MVLPSLLAELSQFCSTFPVSLRPSPIPHHSDYDYPIIFLPAVFLFFLLFRMTKTMYTTSKQLSWILTTAASAIMTLVSIPFVWDYIRSGGDVKSVRTLLALTYTTSRIFQAYLVSDLTMGLIYYRDQVTLLTGWFHHVLYLFIVNAAITRGWTHIFCMLAVMELPTFLLGLSSLNARYRSNLAFALTFFATRIAMHLVWCVSYALPAGRAHAVGGSWVPAAILALVFPMHVMWFRACLKGFVKRYRTLHPLPVPPVPLVPLVLVPGGATAPGSVAPVVPAHSIRFGGYRVRPSMPAFISRVGPAGAWRQTQTRTARAARQQWVRGRVRLTSARKAMYEFVALGLERGVDGAWAEAGVQLQRGR